LPKLRQNCKRGRFPSDAASNDYLLLLLLVQYFLSFLHGV
jgi:hypothetical protein